MLTERLPRDAGTPDLEALIYKSPGHELNLDDYRRLLRCFLREANFSFAAFLTLFGAGYAAEVTAAFFGRLLRRGVKMRGPAQVAGLPFAIPVRPGEPPIVFCLVQGIRSEVGVMCVDIGRKGKIARMRTLTEEGFFGEMRQHGISPLAALKLLSVTLYTAATAETPDRVEPIATRIENLDAAMSRFCERRGLAW